MRGDRQHLARGGIEHHDIAPVRIHAPQRLIKRALSDLLQLGIEGEDDVVPRNRSGDEPRRRLVFAPRAILQDDRRPRDTCQQAVERLLEAGGAMPIVAQAADHRPGERGRRIESVGHRLQVHAPDRANRVHGEGTVGAAEVGIAFAEGLLPLDRRQAQRPSDQRTVAPGIAQLVGGDTDMVGLQGAGDGGAVAIAQRAAPCLEDDALGTAGARFVGPAAPLDQLHLGRATNERQEAEQHQELDGGDADGRSGHGVSAGSRGRGAG